MVTDTTEELEEQTVAEAIAESMAELEGASDTEAEAPEDEVSPEEEASKETEESEDKPVEEDSEESEEPETEVFHAPEHWSSDLKEQFDELDETSKGILLSRDKEFQTGYQEKAQSISAITDALEPWKDALAQRGTTADQAIRVLFAAQHQIDENPVQGILNIAQSYGVLDQIKAAFAPKEDDDPFIDPEVKALKQQVGELTSFINQGQTNAQTAQQQTASRSIEDFATEKDDAGQPLRPYFDQVRGQMAPLVTDGASLQDAYDQVVWTVEEYRTKNTPKTDTTEEKAAKVKKAKRAARSLKTKGNVDSTEGEEDLSLHDELAAAFRQQA